MTQLRAALHGRLAGVQERGASRKANKRLKEAMEFNSHVADYLLGRRRVPRQLPPYIGLSDATEAAHYGTMLPKPAISGCSKKAHWIGFGRWRRNQPALKVS